MRIRFTAAALVVLFVWSLQSATPPQTTHPVPVVRPGDRMTAPRLLYKRGPAYTEEATKARLQGGVVLDFVVGPDGTLSDFRVIQPLGLGLDENAIEAVKDWKFKPGEQDGKPVAMSATAVVNYNLASVVGVLENSRMGWHLGRAVFQTPEGASRPSFLKANSEAPEGHLPVTVSAVINERGEPVTIHVPMLIAAPAEATDLEAAIMEFVRSWRFSPALKDGRPIAVSGTFDLLLSKP